MAVPHRPQRRREPPARAPPPSDGPARRRRGRSRSARRRGPRRGARGRRRRVGRGRAPAGGPTPGDRPALRRRDEHRGDRRRTRSLRERRARPHPPGAPVRGARPRSRARREGQPGPMTFPLRDRADADAILTDLYLDALLAAHDRRATDVPTSADLDPVIRFAAGRLSSDLARVHPSFRFEERLAARLAELAAHMRLAAAAGGSDAQAPLDPSLDPHLDPAFGPDEDPAADPESLHNVRPLLLGGALTSAALSLAGAAYVD